MKLLLPKKNRLPVVLGLFVLVLVAATACASDDSGSTPITTPAQAPNASAPNSAAPPVAPAPVVAQAPEPTAIAIIPRSQPTAALAPRPTVAPAKDLAPELTDPGEWINSEPLTLEGLRSEGKVVLIDFWTYTCINCIRTLPYLKEWHEKYADKGLVILGVHTPEFEFEHVYENVAKAVGEFGLEYPIVQDNDFGTWRAFNNRFWPAKYLIDTEGVIRYEHFGEGSYEETEAKIREILMEAGYDLEGISANTEPEPEVDPDSFVDDSSISRTRELYAGYGRNQSALRSFTTPPYIRHVEYYETTDQPTNYTDPGKHENHFMYLHGLWTNREENLVHAQATENYEDYIAIKFYGTSVNVVMAPETGEPYQVKVTVDDAPVAMDKAGSDIQYDDDGNSFVHVDGSRIYYLVDQSEFSGGEMKLSSNSTEFSLFAFTFGSYEGGEPVKEG
jgi:thiol-disulfide isomerase/thioredoxin